MGARRPRAHLADVHAHFDRLCHDGPSPDAFDFKHAFGPDGQPYQLDREAAKVLMRRNKMQGVLTGYLGAWNEPDAATRRLLLDRVWAPDGHYTDPGSHATDLAGLDAIIGAFHAANPARSSRRRGTSTFTTVMCGSSGI
ncbi:hypothetical protein ACFOUS_00005 [Deinococcus metalli]|uniref:hypothetical protein n=1 Tax=Deinococcus metalli TaxID=1141878 RepID=UPI003620A0F9